MCRFYTKQTKETKDFVLRRGCKDDGVLVKIGANLEAKDAEALKARLDE
jgi:hypothetical protein